MPDLVHNEIREFFQYAKELGEVPSFRSSGEPLQELKRLILLAEDLHSGDDDLTKEVELETKGEKGAKSVSSGGHSPNKNGLHFESRACGTPVPNFHEGVDLRGNGSVIGELEASSLDQTFGTELLRTLAGHPLSPESRIEALRRLTLAMANPNRQNLESVLMILVTNDPFFDQDQRS